MSAFLSILKTTFLQTIRQNVTLVVVLAFLAALPLIVSLSSWTVGADYHASDQRMMENSGLSTLLAAGLAIAALSASHVLSREIEQRTVQTVVSKPVARATFVLAKYAGVALAVALAMYVCAAGFLLAVRHGVMPAAWDKYDQPVIVLGASALVVSLVLALAGNYLFNWSFAASALLWLAGLLTVALGLVSFLGKQWEIVPIIQWETVGQTVVVDGEQTVQRNEQVATLAGGIRPQVLVGLAMISMAVSILVAVAVAAGTRLGQVMIVLVCAAVLLIGWGHHFLFDQWADEVPLARLAGWVFPNLRYFDPQDPLAAERPIGADYLVLAAAYCAAYIAAILAVAVALFQTRQLEAQGTSASMPGAVSILSWGIRAGGVVLAVWAGALLTVPSTYDDPLRAASLGGALLAGLLAWMLGSAFGRGRRWAYALVLAIVLAGLARGLADAWLGALPESLQVARFDQPVLRSATLVALAAVAVVMVLPRTRRHFSSS